MRKYFLAIMVCSILTAGLLTSTAYAGGGCCAKKASDTVKAPGTCPITGEKVNKKFFAEIDGKKIYVCCKNCIQKVIDKCAKAKLNSSKAQSKCPVMGGKIKKKFFTDYKGERVYFCCPMCSGKFKADPAKYLKKLKSAGVVLEKVK